MVNAISQQTLHLPILSASIIASNATHTAKLFKAAANIRRQGAGCNAVTSVSSQSTALKSLND